MDEITPDVQLGYDANESVGANLSSNFNIIKDAAGDLQNPTDAIMGKAEEQAKGFAKGKIDKGLKSLGVPADADTLQKMAGGDLMAGAEKVAGAHGIKLEDGKVNINMD